MPWKFTDGIDYTFPANTSLAPNGRLFVVKNKTAFKSRYSSIPDEIIYGPYADDGSLSNGGEKLELSKPGDEILGMPGQYYYIRVEMVNYSDGSHPVGEAPDPWPTEPDGGGASLIRTGDSGYSNDVVNWQAGTP